MSKKEQNQAQDANLENVEAALTKSEQFIENNQKTLSYIAVIILAIVAGFIGFKRFVVEPKQQEAMASMFAAEQYFAKDSFNLALYGDGNNWGFLDIISDYKVTKAANVAHYYAGICHLYLGEYEEAIKQLEKFDSDDFVVSTVAIGAIGDAYVELGELKKGASQYEDAAANNENELTTPMYLKKAAVIQTELGEYEDAIANYELIKKKYPKSEEGRSADKFISNLKAKI